MPNNNLHFYRCIVKKVIDGDTVKVDIDLGFDLWYYDQNVRLYGVDAPESRTSDKYEEVFGDLAKAKVQDLMPVGGECILRTHIDRGKYGRILGTFLTLGGLDINNYLIENNYAVAYFGMNKGKVRAAHLKNFHILKERGEVDENKLKELIR